MRKTLLVLLIIGPFLLQAQHRSYAVHNKGYFCDVGIALGATFPGTIPRPIVEVYTTHGYQFSNTFSLGLGVGTYNTTFLNLYMQFRFNLRNINETRTHYTYIAVRGGYSWSTWTGDKFGDDRGPLVDPRFGWSFYTKEVNFRWSVYLAPSFYQYTFIPKIGLSFEF